MTETQQRFLRAIAERVPTEDVVEVHLFPAIRQGGVETGVAVVAERPRTVVHDAGTSNGQSPHDADSPPVPDDGLTPTADSPDAVGESWAEATPDVEAEVEVALEDQEAAPVPFARLTVHTARYRLTLKGVDRGKWEVDVVAEADAPLAAVDAVVRGVQRRSGEGAEPDRLSAEAFRDALEAPLATLER